MSRDEDRDEAPSGGAARWSQDDDLFDDESGLDDPDRDSDFAAIYHEDEPDRLPGPDLGAQRVERRQEWAERPVGRSVSRPSRASSAVNTYRLCR